MRDCEICGRPDELCSKPSVLDGHRYDTCRECFAHCAEHWKAIANFLREAEWRELPDEIKRVITVWQDEDYVPVAVGVKRMLKRQLVLFNKEEAEEADDLIRKMTAIRRLPEDIPPPKRGHWFWSILAFLGFFRELPA